MRRFFFNKAGLAAILILANGAAMAQDAAAEKAKEVAGNSDGWLYWGLATVILFLLFFLVRVSSQLKTGEGQEARKLTFREWWRQMDRRLFTKAVDIEHEKDVLLDHDYDGIKELDNALPPWWKYGFYATLVLAVFYILHFHVWGTGPNPEQEYNREMKVAAAQVEEYRKKAGENVDEKSVTMADAAGIAAGKKIFESKCFMCHGQNGEGGVGPNLTDDYWIHGGSINDVFKTIKYGVLDKGMQSWQAALSPSEIKNISSYVKSLKGTRPANAKAPQGDLYQEGGAAPAPVKDSAATAKK